MRKLFLFVAIVFISALIGGTYGILHDQITYSISHEYYTKFKFYQFEFKEGGDEAIFPNPRLAVSLVGFLATWWFGLVIGIVLAAAGLLHTDSKAMWRITIRALMIAMLVTAIAGLAGFFYGYLFLAGQPESEFAHWYIPDNLVDFDHFIIVGSIHNFSYAGGMLGLVAGLGYTIFHAVRNRRASRN